MNKKIVIPLVAAIALIAGGIVWFHNGQPPANELALHGNVDIRQVELAFNASGRIASIDVRDGDRVKRGDLLARLDTERLRLALEQAEAQVTAQQQTVKRLETGSRPEEIRQAQAQREAARVAMADADNFYQRQQSLVARHFISQQQADNARFAFDKARAQWQAASETARLAELGPRREDIAAARATLAASEAAAALIRKDIAEGELRAPSDGVIENRILEVGDMASPQKPVFTLALTDPLWVRVWLPETQLGRIPVGARATVATDSYPDKPYAAWVGHISPSAEFTPKSVETADIRSTLVYQARIFVCDASGELRLGMPATVKIALDQNKPAEGNERSNPCQPAH
ncbi:HlyD family efflux transporter periplasmic adaptor subunit [Propionivibrio limicola]|uniref:HlyD family efflux transporter periplasmic adaptor subunit n=1 Tax=Propionivibrio limicola TaxID=167645 RepID=UPI001291F7C7|nr:HlyD family efflux transporter periplasmic adaptor subunit [Propionivibrio limicola]